MLSQRRARKSRQKLTRLILHRPNEIAGDALVLPHVTYPVRQKGKIQACGAYLRPLEG